MGHMDLKISIKNIKNIKNISRADIELPFERGLYAIVGENGCGKSTLMLLLSFIIKTSSTRMLEENDLHEDSSVVIELGEKNDCWSMNKKGALSTGKYNKNRQIYSSVHYHGFYEGSIFYGSRFFDYNNIDEFLNSSDIDNNLIDCDAFVSESLGYILHNDKAYYKGLKKIKTKKVAKEAGFRGIPYFLEKNERLIS